MKNIYLSYAPADGPRAEELRRVLRAQSYRLWQDPPAPAAVDWSSEREAALQAADALIVLLSESAATSLPVTWEWAYALGAGRLVCAIIYEEVAEVQHPRLRTVPRYDTRAFSDENLFWDHFLADFKRQLAGATAQKGARPTQPQPEPEIDASVKPTEPGYWLVMRRGPQLNQLFRLEREVVNIGRDLANDIVLRDPQVSRYHLRLTLREQDYVLADLGSTNGTRLNGQQISGQRPLKDGDIIALGDSILFSYDLVYLE